MNLISNYKIPGMHRANDAAGVRECTVYTVTHMPHLLGIKYWPVIPAAVVICRPYRHACHVFRSIRRVFRLIQQSRPCLFGHITDVFMSIFWLWNRSTNGFSAAIGQIFYSAHNTRREVNYPMGIEWHNGRLQFTSRIIQLCTCCSAHAYWATPMPSSSDAQILGQLIAA